MSRTILIALMLVATIRSVTFAQPPLRSGHIELHVGRQLSASRLLEELESAYQYVRRQGFRLPERIRVSSYSRSDAYVRGSGGERTSLATAVREEIHLQPLALLLRHGALTSPLRHEMVHVALWKAARRGLPRWLNEGLALRIAGEIHPATVAFRRLEDVERGLRSAVHDDRMAAYSASRRLVDALIGEIGMTRVVTLVAATGGAGSFDRQFRRVVGSSAAVWGASTLRR